MILSDQPYRYCKVNKKVSADEMLLAGVAVIVNCLIVAEQGWTETVIERRNVFIVW